jgi:transcriptional regulator with XRE-family HTH domain
VRELRLERHLSQEKLAELADLHRNYGGGVERGERNVSLLNIVKLAHGLSVVPADLVNLDAESDRLDLGVTAALVWSRSWLAVCLNSAHPAQQCLGRLTPVRREALRDSRTVGCGSR